MIAHVVLFRPLATLSQEQLRAIVQSLTAAMRQLPMVRRCRIGRRVKHGLPGYEQAMREEYEYALVLEFESVEDLRGYLQHPAHSQLGNVFTGGADAALAYDYEMAALDETDGLM
jgi:hypothetical protein